MQTFSIKPLEWERHTPFHYSAAAAVFGVYRIWKGDETEETWQADWCSESGVETIGQYESEDKAKTVSEKDWHLRLASALMPACKEVAGVVTSHIAHRTPLTFVGVLAAPPPPQGRDAQEWPAGRTPDEIATGMENAARVIQALAFEQMSDETRTNGIMLANAFLAGAGWVRKHGHPDFRASRRDGRQEETR